MSDRHEHRPLSSPIGFAHRGGLGAPPQNTLAAFTAALTAGVAGLESDVWLTADGLAVLDHDGVIGPEQQPIGRLDRAALPEHIPTVAELYDTCGADFVLSLDVLDPGAAPSVAAAARRHDAIDRLWLVAPWPGVRPLRRVDPQLHVLANLDWRQLGPGLARILREMGAAGVCGVNLPFWLWNPALVGRVHRAGLLAFGWRANERWQLQWLRRCGCDGLYSDSVAALLAVTGRTPG